MQAASLTRISITRYARNAFTRLEDELPALGTAAFKVVIRGSIGSVQAWSTGFWFKGTVDIGTLDVAQIAGAIQPLVEAWATAIHGYWTPTTQYEGLDVYYYPATGTVATEVGHASPSSPVVGVSSTAAMPTYVSAVHSLKTLNVGRSYRGRAYVPTTNMPLAASGQMDNSTCVALATAFRDILSGVNALDLTASGVTGPTCVVASFTKGLTTPVNRVTVDSLMDVQHRREDSFGPAHTAVEYV